MQLGGVKSISVVIPVYNEEECIPLLERELLAALTPLPVPWEVILVDDASMDRTPELLADLCQRRREFRTLRFAENRRQSAAMAAGIRAARGSVIVTMDADLQNDPADIAKLLECLGDYDAVCGIRVKREDSWFRRVQSRIANRVRGALLGDRITDTGCSLKAFRAEKLKDLPFFRGAHRFFPALLQMEGGRVTEIPVNHRPRAAGVAKWGLWNRVFAASTDLLGVMWLKSRAMRYRVAREVGEGLPRPL